MAVSVDNSHSTILYALVWVFHPCVLAGYPLPMPRLFQRCMHGLIWACRAILETCNYLSYVCTAWRVGMVIDCSMAVLRCTTAPWYVACTLYAALILCICMY